MKRPFVILFAFWSYILRRVGGAGEQVISFGKNRAKLYTETEEKVTFNDVAGVEDVADLLLKVAQINVETYKSVVQLSGWVDSAAQIGTAGSIAGSVDGVTSVKNDLRLK